MEVHRPMEDVKRPLPATVGLLDALRDGWFNLATGELAPGVKIHATDTVIDVGCGDGGNILFCARQGAEVILVDQDEERLASTEAKVKATPAHAYRAIVSDCNPIPLPAETGDVVICTEVLEHVEDPRQFLSELVRIAKTGSSLLITVPDACSETLVGSTAPSGYFREPNHVRIFAAGELRNILLEAGLEIVGEQRLGCFWSMYMALSWLTSESDEILQINNPHPIPDYWTRLWQELQNYPGGDLVKDALNELIPRTHAFVLRKSG